MIQILLFFTAYTEACVYSQSHWLSNASEPWPTSLYPLNQPLCGISWYTLMHLNTSQVRETGSTYFLLAFHQLCTAVLNVDISSTSSSIPSDVSLSINVIYDSMQRYCTNMSGWVLESQKDNVLAGHLSRLIQFNHAGAPCDPISALPFSFTQSPQLFFLGYNETEQSEAKRQAEVIQHIYKVQTLLAVFSTMALFLIFIQIIYIVMLKNMRREYSCCKEYTEVGFYDVSGADDFVINGSGEECVELDSPRNHKEKSQ